MKTDHARKFRRVEFLKNSVGAFCLCCLLGMGCSRPSEKTRADILLARVGDYTVTLEDVAPAEIGAASPLEVWGDALARRTAEYLIERRLEDIAVPFRKEISTDEIRARTLEDYALHGVDPREVYSTVVKHAAAMHGFLDLYEAGEREEANRYYEERLPDYSRAIPFEQFSEILENPKSLEFYRKMTHAPDSYDEFLLMGINNDRNDVISRIAKERLVEKEIETVPDLSPEDIVYFSKAVIARELMEDMETRLLLEKRAIHNWREELLTERIATELLREGVEVLHPALGGLKEVLEVEAEGD